MIGYNSLAVFLFSALALVLHGGYSVGATLLFVASALLLLLLLGTILGMAGSLLSGSRGGWIAIPVCAGMLCLHYASVHGRRYLYAGLLALAALIALAHSIPQSTVKARTLASLQEARDFTRAGNIETSLGQRVEMWRSALAMVPEQPLLGSGKPGYMSQKMQLIGEGKIAPSIGEYTNAHNEYLDTLVKQSLVGLLALPLLFLLPLPLFARRIKSGKRQLPPYALAGVSLNLSYMVFGLTTTFLTLNIGVMTLAFLTVVLWSGLCAASRSPPAPPRPQL